MNTELIFRGFLAAIGAPLLAIRIYYTIRMSRFHTRYTADRTSKVIKILAWPVGIFADLVIVIYIFAPTWLNWAALPVPDGLRWFGVGLGLISIPLFLWAHYSLGKEFNYPGAIREQQDLVTSGPYRWVRHPIYSGYFLWTGAFFLMSANWLIGAIWLIFSIFAAMNIGIEEKALIAYFGQPYQDYMQHTGRFLPRLL